MVGREQLFQGANALGEFLPQVNGIEIPHGNPQEFNTAGSVVGFERLPIEIDGAHIIIRLQIKHSGDAGLQPQPVNVMSGLGMRTEEELRKKLSVIHTSRTLPERQFRPPFSPMGMHAC